jgi:hypothetical protein
MTFSRWRKVIESPDGVGRVSLDNKAIAEVGYSLSVELEDLVAKTFGGKPKAYLKQTKFITGNISVIQGNIEHDIIAQGPSAQLTLLLEDRRELDFRIVEPEPGGSEYEIQGIGDFRPARQQGTE